MIRNLWRDYLLPMLRRPPRYQVAALCWRLEGDAFRLLLLTSRDTGRWVLPKGWPKAGLDAAATAAEEAWEEGGVRLDGPGRPIGRYTYDKRMRGVPVGTEVDVFAFRVRDVADDFPEAAERRRDWVTPEEAAARVDEPSLGRLLSGARDALVLDAPGKGDAAP